MRASHRCSTLTTLTTLCVALAVSLAACGPGNNGGAAIAFLRGGALFTIAPDGTGLYQVEKGPIVGFAWSPDHHQFVARFPATNPIPAPDFAGGVAADPAVLGIFSIDGGNILVITPAGATASRGDAWWNASGNRLYYRESGAAWIQSQADQPGGIARKTLATDSTAMPTSSPNSDQVATLTTAGQLVIGAPGVAPRVVRPDALAALPSGWPARALWQPLHQAILYPTPGPAGVTLTLTDLAGHASAIATIPDLLSYAWSPDGSRLIWRTGTGYTVRTMKGGAEFSWAASDPATLAWWSPDGRYLLTSAPGGALTLVTVATGTTLTLLAGTNAKQTASQVAAAALALDHPLTGNPWEPGGDHFVLVAPGGAWRGGKALAVQSGAGDGLYVVDATSPAAPPTLRDWGEHTSVSWSTPDPNTQFPAL